ncbi:MAG TPA: histidinol dehydrogenase [Clostridiaceae bacterium]
MMDIYEYKSLEGKNFLKELKERGKAVQGDVTVVVEAILKDISLRGNDAVLEYTRKFDYKGITLDNLRVSEEEIEEALTNSDPDFIKALEKAKNNILMFHEKQKNNSWMDTQDRGIVLGQLIRPLEKVGIYVPGGTATYPSTVLMNAVPAKAAGVNRIVMVTPPGKDGKVNAGILAAASLAGITEIYKVGGAQAIGALAYGTETIPKVDKIVGPGNLYVALAKKAVYGLVDIDMIAGPSEILIVAEEDMDPSYIAADLMSQAEHDVLASSILITTSISLAAKVNIEIERQIKSLSRENIIRESLKNYGGIIISRDIMEAIDISNHLAPEHLELMVKEAFAYLSYVKNAGSIFLGGNSPEPLGDYMAGPNHVLPTSGTARFFSPLSLDDFVKKSGFVHYTKDALFQVKDDIIKLAETEGLTAHANSIKVRF